MEPIRSIEPQIPSPNDLPNPKSPWIMSQSVFDRVQSSADKGSYKICELSNMDPEWSFVQEYFQAHKPNNRSIKRACCIHNADSTRQFEALIPSLEKEANMPAFAPKWQQEEEAPLRQIAMNRFDRLSGMYTAPLISSNQRQTNYQNVTVLPLWHGTTAAICDSICKTGFAFFGKHQHIHSSGNTDQNTDIGYFGSGIYFTNSARYAADIYSDGNLILAYVSMRKPYPVVADCSYPAKPRDMKKLGGLGAYENYNAHYIPVISIDPTNQKCAVYYPCALNQSPALDEFVVFQKSQALARFWLELDIDLPKSLPSATITNITIEIFLQKVLDLLDSDSIQQDQEVYALLEGKSDILFAMNPYETLKEADLKFYNSLLQILDQSGKIRGIVKKRFLQIEQPTSPPIAQLSHVSSLNIPQMIQPICLPSTPLPSTPMEKAEALYDFTGHDSSTLSFKKGDIIHITEKKGDWWKGELNGKTGYVPSNFMQLIQVLAPISILPQIPSIAFGKAKWATYFGDIGEEPPLPNNIQTILSSPCPFWPNKKVEETHLLVLIPKTVNDRLFTLAELAELIKKPKQGSATRFRLYQPGGNENPSIAHSYWVLMTRDIVEGTRNKRYANQIQIVSEFSKSAGVNYQAPKLLEALTCILMEYVSNGTRLYSDHPWTYTRCQEKYADTDCQMVVGGFAVGGLIVSYYFLARDSLGLASLRKF